MKSCRIKVAEPILRRNQDVQSYTELIKETLNTLELNVTFEKNCLRKEKINGQICKVYTEKLTYLQISVNIVKVIQRLFAGE